MAVPALLLPLLIRYFVVKGIATATEVSVVGIIYTVIIGVAVYREFKWRSLYPTLIETVSLAGAILLIIATATAMGWALTQSGFAQQLADILSHAPGGKVGIMLLSIVMFIVLGSVLEGIPAMVLFGPLLFPVAKAAGINEVHYAIVAVLAMGVGTVRAAAGDRVLRGERDRQIESGERRQGDGAVHDRADHRTAAHRVHPVDLARFSAQGARTVR